MTDAEMRQLAQIERQLVAESPQLRRLFDDSSAARRRRRRAWCWAGVLTAVICLALLVSGLALGVPGLAVFALCPALAFGGVLSGTVLLRGRPG